MTQTATQPRYIDTTDVARLVRQALKARFPGVKFSVRSRGGSVDVHWTTGPTWSEVNATVAKFGSRRADHGHTRHWLCPQHGVTVATVADTYGRTDHDACCPSAETVVMVADYVIAHRPGY